MGRSWSCKNREIGKDECTQKPIVLVEGSASILRPVLADSPQTPCSLLCSLNTVDLLSHTLKCSLLLHSFQILPCFLKREKVPPSFSWKHLRIKLAIGFSWEFKILVTCLLPSSHLFVPDGPYFGSRELFTSPTFCIRLLLGTSHPSPLRICQSSLVSLQTHIHPSCPREDGVQIFWYQLISSSPAVQQPWPHHLR